MSEPISFTSASPRYGFPFLFVGQAQKEFFVNEAHALADTLLHPTVEGVVNDPPLAPAEGECWLIGDAPSGEWTDHPGEIASRQSGGWLFVSPRNGLTILDESSGQIRRYLDGWHAATPISEPAGGTVVDAEARTAITQLISALAAAGILPAA